MDTGTLVFVSYFFVWDILYNMHIRIYNYFTLASINNKIIK
jgi:hypothetical protein